MTKASLARAVLGFAGGTVLMSCGGGDQKDREDPVRLDGAALYARPMSDGNTFACATCHALTEPADDGFTRPGHPIGDAIRRPTFKNGLLTNLLDAVNTCRVEWMGAKPFSADEDRWIALRSFLAGSAPAGSAPAITFQIVPPPAQTSGGDAQRGRFRFNRTCVVCHDMDGTGTERAPPVTGQGLGADYIAQRIRTSGTEDSAVYRGLQGGRMPFWSADRLSDQDLLDIVAFVSSEPSPPPMPDAGAPPDAGQSPDTGSSSPSPCGASHQKVGQIARLRTLFHGVSGTARVVDDCTIEITTFNFDGGGINVQAYGALGRRYEEGFSMSGDLRRPGGYKNETLRVQLPKDRTLDDLDGISIWCVPARANFGDGLFAPP